ncbi:MAG: hypothetical protein ABW224_22090 [Kibdelosporangium sp.]
MKPKPEVRQRVRALAESAWREPATVVYLDEVRPSFDVPGRRKDGTVKGKRLVRRFFRNIVRGVVGVPIDIVLSIAGGGAASLFGRDGKVTGPANAQALELVDAAMAADSPWLVHSPSHIAVVDTGPFFNTADSQPPAFRWHTTKPHMPEIAPRHRRLTWPDGSVFEPPRSWNDENPPATQPG